MCNQPSFFGNMRFLNLNERSSSIEVVPGQRWFPLLRLLLFAVIAAFLVERAYCFSCRGAIGSDHHCRPLLLLGPAAIVPL